MKTRGVPKKKNKKISKQSYAIILFGLSLLIFFLVIVPGESAWLFIHNLIIGLFGICSILWPVLLTYISLMLAFGKFEDDHRLQIYLACVVIILFCTEFYVFSRSKVSPPAEFLNHISSLYKNGIRNFGSGVIGGLIGAPLTWGVGITGMRVINSLLLFIFIMILMRVSLASFLKGAIRPFVAINRHAKEYRDKKRNSTFSNKANEKIPWIGRNNKIDISLDDKSKNRRNDNPPWEQNNNDTPSETSLSSKESEEIAKVTEAYINKIKKENSKSSEIKAVSKNKEALNKVDINKTVGEYKYPPVNFLNESEKVDEGTITEELQFSGQMLVDTLKSFNVKTKIVAVSRGPAVTRYELQPASGVKISRITGLADDIALNLAASGVRIEAPIPGKAAVGIEIPNKAVSVVNMNELISSSVFRSAKSKLTVVLGRDISGKVIVTDLSKMPHLLIAGSTGSGKSVCINSFIISLIYKASPEEVKLIMIDPKVVELGIYNGIPHLLIPVVTDPRKAKGALSWAVDEMLRRYKTFADTNVRDMHSYNSYIDENPGIKDSEGNTLEKMYSIVIIIDELSDLMMVAPNEIEDCICRLAQMARAAGMHLVIATQRPSVDVITGIIKANIPSRIALAVSSQVDSRTILDMSGAEKLLGRGDMLFSPIGSSKPVRIQGCYVTDKEIENIINYVKDSQKDEYDSKVMDEIEKSADIDKKEEAESKASDEIDPMLNEAIECVVAAGQASTSLLQRRLRLGYARAGRLIDEMEKMGIVGPHEGSKPRQLLINRQQLIEMNLRKSDSQ